MTRALTTPDCALGQSVFGPRQGVWQSRLDHWSVVSIFLVNIPICALGLVLTLRCVPPAQWAKRKHRTFDLAGQSLAIVALTALIGTVIEARPLGLTHPIVAAGSLLARDGCCIYRSRGANCNPDVAVTFFPATWFYPGNCFWRVGQLYLLRNHFCS